MQETQRNEMKRQHLQNLADLRAERLKPWQPLQRLLGLQEFRRELIDYFQNSSVQVLPIEPFLRESASTVELRDPDVTTHWLKQLGIYQLATNRFLFGWEDLMYQPEESVEYLREAVSDMKKEICSKVDEIEGPITVYLGQPELVVAYKPSLELYVKILVKTEE